MQSISQENAEKLGNRSEVGISFDGSRTKRIAGIKSECVFEKIDGSFNGHSVTVKIIPMLRTTGNTGIKAKVLVGIGVDTLSVSRFGAWVFTGADSFTALLHGTVTDPFETKRTVFTAGSAKISKGRAVNRTDGSTVFVKHGIGAFGVSDVERDAGSVKVKNVLQHRVVIVRIESGISNEGLEE